MYYLRIQSRAIRRLHFNRPAEGTREAELSLVPGKFSVRILPGHWEENILGERHGILGISTLLDEIRHFNWGERISERAGNITRQIL